MDKSAMHCWHETGARLLMGLNHTSEQLEEASPHIPQNFLLHEWYSALSRPFRSLGTSIVRLEAHLPPHRQLHALSPAQI